VQLDVKTLAWGILYVVLVIKGTGPNALQPAADDSLERRQRHAASRCDPLRLGMCGSKWGGGGDEGQPDLNVGSEVRSTGWPERPE